MGQDRAQYVRWIRMKQKDHVAEWDDRNVFYRWCDESGYRAGLMLWRKDKRKPYGPDNCFWKSGKEKRPNPEGWEADFCRRWAKGVNPLRELAGLPLLPEN